MPNFFSVSYLLGYQRALAFYNTFISTFADAAVGYVMLGRNISWGANDAAPPIYDTENTIFDTYNNFLGGKKVTGNDIGLVIPRVNWVANVVWTPYDDASNTLFTSANSMYIYTSGSNVYKCLDNANGSISTIEPANNYTTANGFVATGDGYLWKYMYKVPSTSKFLTSAWIPVPVTQDPAYFGFPQNLVPGEISRLILTTGGSGYSNTNTTIVITGSGSLANALANVNANGNVSSITLVNRGLGYIRQNTHVTVVGSGTGANVRAILSPYLGHGFNPARELAANTVMIAVKVGDVDSSENGNITANNSFRQTALLLSPHPYGSNIALLAANANVSVTMATQIILTAGGSYLSNELVYQGNSASNSAFSAYVSDVFTNAVQMTGRIGTPIIGQLLIGANSGISRTVVSFKNPDLDPESGDVVYTENRGPVVRSDGQAEWVKIVLQF